MCIQRRPQRQGDDVWCSPLSVKEKSSNYRNATSKKHRNKRRHNNRTEYIQMKARKSGKFVMHSIATFVFVTLAPIKTKNLPPEHESIATQHHLCVTAASFADFHKTISRSRFTTFFFIFFHPFFSPFHSISCHNSPTRCFLSSRSEKDDVMSMSEERKPFNHILTD